MTPIFYLTALSLPLLFISCHTPKPDNVPPIKVGFNHANLNKEYLVNVSILKPRTYSVTMEYYLVKPEEYRFFVSLKKAEDKIAKSHKLGEILGLKYGTVFEDSGVPAKYNVKIYDPQKRIYIINETVTNPETFGVYVGRYATLTSAFLTKGEYLVYVTYLGGSVDLNSLYTEIVITRSHHGK